MTTASPTFDDYVASRGAALLRLAFMLTGDQHLAEDLTQDVLVRIYGRWSRVAGMEQVDSYVRRALVNTHVSWRRRRSSGELPLPEPSDVAHPAAADSSDAAADRDQAWRLLATLPPKQRAVLVLRYYEDLSDREVADVLGCSAGTVRSQASRALATLRGNLRDVAAIGGAGRD